MACGRCFRERRIVEGEGGGDTRTCTLTLTRLQEWRSCKH